MILKSEIKSYLAVLGSFLKRRSGFVRKCRHVSSFEDLVILLRLSQFNVGLHSSAAKLLDFWKNTWVKYTLLQRKNTILSSFWGAFSTSFFAMGQLTLASLPWFLNWFRRATFSDIFGCQEKVQQHPEEV